MADKGIADALLAYKDRPQAEVSQDRMDAIVAAEQMKQNELQRQELSKAMAELDNTKAEIARRLAELQRENDRKEQLVQQERVENARREVLEKRLVEERERLEQLGSTRKVSQAALKEKRALARASNLARIKDGYATLDAYGQPYAHLPLDRDVIEHADPYDDRLPVNFDTRSPDWKEFVASGRYDEFCDEHGLRHVHTKDKPPAYSKIDDAGNETFYDEAGNEVDAPEFGW